jgi:hypothetical protein
MGHDIGQDETKETKCPKCGRSGCVDHKGSRPGIVRGQKKPIWKRWRCDRPDCADKLADDGCHCSCPYNPRKCCITHRRKAKWIEVI